MNTVIVRLSPPSGDGKLHGRLEVIGGESVVFTDDTELLDRLHAANRRDETVGG